MDTDLQQKLTELDNGQKEIIRRFEEMSSDLRNVVVELGGVPESMFREPDRRSIRFRLHALENDREAVKIAGQAVQAANQARDQMRRQNEENAMARFSRREKLLGLLFAGLMLLSPYLSALALGH